MAHAATREALGLPVSGQVSQDPGGNSVHRSGAGQKIDLHEAVIVARPGHLPNAERTAAAVLAEELEKRTGLRLRTSITWPEGKPVIALSSVDSVPAWKQTVPQRQGSDLAEKKPEGYRLYVNSEANPPVVWVIGADARGTLFGIGNLLRRLDWSQGKLTIPSNLDIATAPAYEIRGHQLGYRPHSNSYDAWDPAQFEQYIREMTFFGANSVEGIPFQENLTNPLMRFPRWEINQAIGDPRGRPFGGGTTERAEPGLAGRLPSGQPQSFTRGSTPTQPTECEPRATVRLCCELMTNAWNPL